MLQNNQGSFWNFENAALHSASHVLDAFSAGQTSLSFWKKLSIFFTYPCKASRLTKMMYLHTHKQEDWRVLLRFSLIGPLSYCTGIHTWEWKLVTDWADIAATVLWTVWEIIHGILLSLWEIILHVSISKCIPTTQMLSLSHFTWFTCTINHNFWHF